jgi:hypothetical protein
MTIPRPRRALPHRPCMPAHRILRLFLVLLLAAPVAARASEPAELAERDLLFAVHRMAGTEPDFGALAELEVAAQPAPAGVRDEAADRRYRVVLAARRLRAEFAAFDPDRAFTVTLGADILGHDRERGGIPLEAGLDHGLKLRDPVNRERGFELRFRNAEAVEVIPVGGTEAGARLRAAGLASFGDRAGAGSLALTIAFAGLPPRIPEMRDIPVSVEILSARVQAASGATLHGFEGVGSLAAARAARSAPPVLGAAEVGGLRIGMSAAEAWHAAIRSHPEPFGGAFHAGLPEHARRFGLRPDCSAGLVADIRAFGIPLAPQHAYAACLVVLLGEGEDALAGRVVELTGLRFLPDVTPEELRFDLQDRFGPPLAELAEGPLVWVGRDPAAGGTEGLLELRAAFVRVAAGGPGGEPGSLLALTLRRHRPAEDAGS